MQERKRISTKEEYPRLEEGDTREFWESRRKRLRRWSSLYLATVLSVTVLCGMLLVAGIGRRGGLLSQSGEAGRIKRSEVIAAWLLGNDFFHFSAKNAQEDDGKLDEMLDWIGGVLTPEDSSQEVMGGESTEGTRGLYDFDYSLVPAGQTPILPMDLSLSTEGASYFHNETGFTPNGSALLAGTLTLTDPRPVAGKQEPLVLIVHTHGTEGYSADGAISYADDGGELCRTSDTESNVVAVGKVLADTLRKNGIPTLHATVMHDSVQYKDSYARAEETIRAYRQRYPSIRLVIDLHRDSVFRSTGEMVRPVTMVDGQATAQVMCVVGSEWGGESNPNWQNNLSLALKLRESLNGSYGNLCRPPYLREHTYNQELSPYGMLLEVGSSGNSLAEAERAAVLVGEALCELIRQM